CSSLPLSSSLVTAPPSTHIFPLSLHDALPISIVVGVGAGIISAVRQNSWLDNTVMVFVVAGYSLPSFWVGLLLIMFFGVRLGWRSEEHTSELQSRFDLVCRLLLEKKKMKTDKS